MSTCHQTLRGVNASTVAHRCCFTTGLMIFSSPRRSSGADIPKNLRSFRGQFMLLVLVFKQVSYLCLYDAHSNNEFPWNDTTFALVKMVCRQ